MSDQMQEYIDEAEKDLLHTYNRYQVVLDRGEGVYLYDINGKKYLDFVAGIAVFALGYHNEAYNNALKDQIDKVIHTSNYYYNVPAIEAAGKLKNVLATYTEAEDLINIGAYKSGANPNIDYAIQKIDRVNEYLRQDVEKKYTFEEELELLSAIF